MIDYRSVAVGNPEAETGGCPQVCPIAQDISDANDTPQSASSGGDALLIQVASDEAHAHVFLNIKSIDEFYIGRLLRAGPSFR